MYYIEDAKSLIISFSKVEISSAAFLFGGGRGMVVQAKWKRGRLASGGFRMGLKCKTERYEIWLLIICADLCYEAQTVSSLSGS